MYKKKIILILAFLIFISFFNQVSANFICGKVVSNETSASWMHTKLFYSDQPNKYTYCEVSPQDGKYCCDPLDIKSVSWAKGKQLNAEIYDNDTGYFAQKVSKVISGEGFDLFPDLELKSILKTSLEDEAVFVNIKNISINLTLNYPFDKIDLKMVYSNITLYSHLCNNCSYYVLDLINLSYGKYELYFTVFDDKNRTYIKKNAFTNLKFLNVSRTISGYKSNNNFVFSKATQINISLTVNASDKLNVNLIEYYPNDWQIYSTDGGIAKPYSDTHDAINWEVNDSLVVKNYSLIPIDTLYPKKYYFQSELNGILSPIHEVILYRFIKLKFLALTKDFNFSTNDLPIIFPIISKEKPLVFKINNRSAYQIVVLPKHQRKNVFFFVKDFESKKVTNFIYGFDLYSNIPNNEIDKVIIDFKFNKNVSEKSYAFYHYINLKKMNEIDFFKVNSDEEYDYYRAETDKLGKFALIGENNE